MGLVIPKMPSAEQVFVGSVTIADAFASAGVGRSTNQEQIAKFLAVFGLPYEDINGKPYAFCAAGSYYADAKSFMLASGIPFNADTIVTLARELIPVFRQHFYDPDPGVVNLVAGFRRHGIWLPAEEVSNDTIIKPGWKAVFDFGGGDHHVEIVKEDGDDTWTDVGFNTTLGCKSGMVAVKERGYTDLWGFARTY